MSSPVRKQPAWVPALIAAGAHIAGCGMSIAIVVGWIVLANYWLGMSNETALLSFIAFTICVSIAEHNQRAREPQLTPEKDFYVVTLSTYRWNPTTNLSRPKATKPELGGTIHAYDTLAVAEIKYEQMEVGRSSLDLEMRDLSYHETFGYEEEEARLWIIYARSKTEAHDKVFYDDSRSRLGHDGRTDDLLLHTDNERRRKQYIDW